MRGAAFVVVMGVVGCATVGGPPAPAKAAAAKNEVVVIGKGPEPMPGMRPQDEGTDYIVYMRQTYRCTRKRPSAKNPIEDSEHCRNISNNESRNPDPGRVERSKTQGGFK